MFSDFLGFSWFSLIFLDFLRFFRPWQCEIPRRVRTRDLPNCRRASYPLRHTDMPKSVQLVRRVQNAQIVYLSARWAERERTSMKSFERQNCSATVSLPPLFSGNFTGNGLAASVQKCSKKSFFWLTFKPRFGGCGVSVSKKCSNKRWSVTETESIWKIRKIQPEKSGRSRTLVF